MGKLTQTSEDIVSFIENIISEKTSLERYITWRILSDEKQKELIKIAKSSAVTEYFAKMCDSIIIYVNEEIFDRMQPNNVGDVDYRSLVIEDALVNIQIIENENTGAMKIQIVKPQICISGDGYAKYGETLVHAAETASMAYDQIKEEERQRKEAEKERRKSEKASRKQDGNN